ncbi:hypothetical protein LB507_007907 [Fusarium sp. FIESC RH6]|nr:hypothetical protein LB507_007907 [Fusarium sp. FIESC RH6]
MAPQKAVTVRSTFTKALRKNLIAKDKHGSLKGNLWVRSQATQKNGTHCKTILCLPRSKSNRFPEAWAKGSAQAALAEKRFDFKTDPFTLLVMKILKEQNPTTFRSIRVQKQAICALQDSAESFLIKVLAGM